MESLSQNNITYSCPYEGLGLWYLKEGNETEAKANFEKAIEINPTVEYRKYNGLATIYIKQKNYTKAKFLLEQSIQNYPHQTEAHELLKKVKHALSPDGNEG